MFSADLEWLVTPAGLLGQFRILHNTNKAGGLVPVAFASWAFLDDEAEARIKRKVKTLRPADW